MLMYVYVLIDCQVQHLRQCDVPQTLLMQCRVLSEQMKEHTHAVSMQVAACTTSKTHGSFIAAGP